MPQRDHLDKAALQLLLSICSPGRVGRVQLKTIVPSPALHEPRAPQELLSLSCAKNVLLTILSGFLFLA